MKQICVFDPETNENIDVSEQLPGEWEPWQGEPSAPGEVFVQRIDEPFEWVGQNKTMTYEAGDYVAVAGEPGEASFAMWPVRAETLPTSDGRHEAVARYYGA